MSLRPGATTLATDVCVPISRLAECVEETQRDIAETGLIAPIVGPCRRRQFPPAPLVDLDDADEVARLEAFLERLVRRALAMEGTCTGEHGVGQEKIKYLEIEHPPGDAGPDADAEARIDPLNIMNPGKIVAL